MLCLCKMMDNVIFVIMFGATISDKVGKQAGDSWDRVAPYLFSDASDGSVAGRRFPLGYPLEKAYKVIGVSRATGGDIWY